MSSRRYIYTTSNVLAGVTCQFETVGHLAAYLQVSTDFAVSTDFVSPFYARAPLATSSYSEGVEDAG